MKTIAELAKAVRQPQDKIAWAIRVNLIPGPNSPRRKFSEVQFQRVVEKLTAGIETTPVYARKTAAKLLGISVYRLRGLQSRGWIEAPAATSPRGFPAWTQEQLAKIKAEVPRLKKLSGRKPHPLHHYTQPAAARELGIPTITLRSWIIKREIPAPARRFKGHHILYYSGADLETIRGKKADYFEERH